MRAIAVAAAVAALASGCGSGGGSDAGPVRRSTTTTTVTPAVAVRDVGAALKATTNVRSATVDSWIMGVESDGTKLEDHQTITVDFGRQASSGQLFAPSVDSFKWVEDGGRVWLGPYGNPSPLAPFSDTDDPRYPPDPRAEATLAPFLILLSAVDIEQVSARPASTRYSFRLPAKRRSLWLMLLRGSNPYSAAGFGDRTTGDATGTVDIVDGRVTHLEILFPSVDGRPSESMRFTLRDLDSATPASPPA